MNDKVAINSYYRFLLVIRQACLLIAGWVESETNTRGAALGELRSSTEPNESPLQFRNLTEAELEAIADRVAKKMNRALLQPSNRTDTMNV